ncbi:MAG: RNA 2',3'-cyclic phosphodiesterase [Spirochaetes bacterium]|nr:RNA 2',3'-cyclic phosphodiesterase [Spirochaetota bacterium]
MRRFFIAIPLPLEIGERLYDMTPEGEGIRAVPIGNHHLTLRFLGELSESSFGEVRDALEEVEFPRLELRFQGVGFFPQGGRPKVLWAGVAPLAPLSALQKTVDKALSGCRLSLEKRPFVPHITLARLENADDGELAVFLKAHHAWEAPGFPAHSITLFESRPGGKGPRYEPVAEYRLGSLMDFLLE